MDYGRLVLQRWDQGAGRIPDLQVYGPPPIARMTEQLFGENGIYAGDIARAHDSPQQPRRLRGPRRQAAAASDPHPRVTEIHAGSVIDGNGWKITVAHAQHAQPYLECVALRLDTARRFDLLFRRQRRHRRQHRASWQRAATCSSRMNHFFSGTEPTPAFRAATGNHRDNAEIAKRAGVKTLVLTHLTEADRSARHPRADRPRNPGGLRRHGDLGRGLDEARRRQRQGHDDRDEAGCTHDRRSCSRCRARDRRRRRISQVSGSPIRPRRKLRETWAAAGDRR